MLTIPDLGTLALASPTITALLELARARREPALLLVFDALVEYLARQPRPELAPPD
jgi:hypothetical protein